MKRDHSRSPPDSSADRYTVPSATGTEDTHLPGEGRPAIKGQVAPPARAAPHKTWSPGLSAPRDFLVVVILVLAGIFDWLSGNPIHSILLFGAAAAVVAGDAPASRSRWGMRVAAAPSGVGAVVVEAGPPRPGPSARRPAARIALPGGVAYAIIVGGLARYSWPATIVVGLTGSIAITIAWRKPLPTGGRSARLDRLGAAVWGSVFAGLGILECTNLLLQPSLKTNSYAHPTLSVLTDPILASHPGRSIALFLWLALGWFLVQR
jgi:hypothetical protein